MPTEEQWKPIESFPDYEISSLGRVRHHTYKVMRPATARGYRRIRLCDKGRQQRFHVHTLVTAAFLGPRPEGLEVNHKDGNRANNNIDNLEYVTKSENQLHTSRVLNKPRQTGSKHGMHILTEDRVIDIRAKGGLNIPQAVLAHDYGVSISTISMILARKTWRHI